MDNKLQNLLSHLSFHQLCWACLVFGTVSLFGVDRFRRDLSTIEEHAAWQEGFRILSHGDAGLRDLMRRMVAGAHKTRTHTLAGIAGPIFTWLHTSSEDGVGMRRLRECMARLAFRYLPTVGGEVLFGVRNANPVMHTMSQVQEIFGVDRFEAARIARLAGALFRLRESGPNVVLAKDAIRIFSQTEELLSDADLAREWASTRAQVVALAKAEYLKPAFLGSDASPSFWRSDVEAFEQALRRTATPVSDWDISVVTLQRAAWRSAPDMVEQVGDILMGKTKELGYLPNEPLFRALVLPRAQVHGRRDPRGAFCNNGLSQAEVADRLGTKSEAVTDLIRLGKLVGTGFGSRGSRASVTRKSVAHFDRVYLSLGKLASLRSIDHRLMRYIVERANVHIAVLGVRGRFYLRDQLRAAGLV